MLLLVFVYVISLVYDCKQRTMDVLMCWNTKVLTSVLFVGVKRTVYPQKAWHPSGRVIVI